MYKCDVEINEMYKCTCSSGGGSMHRSVSTEISMVEDGRRIYPACGSERGIDMYEKKRKREHVDHTNRRCIRMNNNNNNNINNNNKEQNEERRTKNEE